MYFTSPTRLQNLKYLDISREYNSKAGHVALTTPLSGKIFLSAGCDLLWQTYIAHLMAVQNAEN